MTAEESILAFVKARKNSTTAEINRHFKAEGRGGRANQAIGRLANAMRLKRTPLGKDMLGRRYSLP